MRTISRYLVVIAATTLLLPGCGKKKEVVKRSRDEEPRYFKIEPVSVEGTDKNRLANEPTEFLRSRSDDAIHWQPWTPDLLETARLEQRPIFVVVANGEYSTSREFLDAFNDPKEKLVSRFNDRYLCTLVDANANPELGLISYVLSREINAPFAFPYLIWLSHEGNPVGWNPINASALDRLKQVIGGSDDLVAQVWEDSPSYFINNSQVDMERRRKTVEPEPIAEPPGEKKRTELLLSSVRELSALYDPATRTIDGSGGLVPAELLRFIAISKELPGVPGYVRTRADRMLTEMSNLLMTAPITDPLDQGIYSSRRSRGWILPTFTKSSITQSEMAVTYAHAYETSGDEKYSKQAEATLTWMRRSLGSDEAGVGAYQSLRKGPDEEDLYFWSMPDLKDLLTPEQLRAAELAFGVKREGNIPIELDPDRRYFRKSILFNAKTTPEVATALGVSEAEAGALVSAAAETLRAHRAVKAGELNALVSENTRITEVNAIHAFALLRCGHLLDRSDFIAEGRALLAHLKKTHYDERGGLWRIPPVDERRGVKARGRDYASLINASLEAYRLNLDPADLAWAEALARECLHTLGKNGPETFIGETPEAEQVIPLTLYYNFMIVGRSTWGSLLGPFDRLSRLSSKEIFRNAANAIMLNTAQGTTAQAALVHTDYLESNMVEASNCVAILHGDQSAPEFPELHRILLKTKYLGVVIIGSNALDRNAHQPFEVPKNSVGVTLFRSGTPLGTAPNAEELEALLEKVLNPQ